MKLSRIGRFVAALLLCVAGVVAVATPSYAACGDSGSQWVSGTGSAWSGTLDGTTAFTAAFLPPVLGVQAAATVIVLQSGAGTWAYDSSFRWSASAAGVWEYHFEVGANTCSGGDVTEAGGGATDGLMVVHSVTMTRTA